jgi:putative transcriptional regulator
MKKKKSAILEAVYNTARGLHRVGVIDQTTFHEFDRLCLRPNLKPQVTPIDHH